jgi:hypothetical protein
MHPFYCFVAIFCFVLTVLFSQHLWEITFGEPGLWPEDGHTYRWQYFIAPPSFLGCTFLFVGLAIA